MKEVVFYSEEDNQLILETIDNARELNLDLTPVYTELGDRLERNPQSIQAKYYYLKKRDKTPSSRAERSGGGIASKLKGLVRDRDKYKESSEIYKQQRDEYKSEADALRKDYDKVSKELAELLEIIDNI